jgi:glycosyltransferase involved in cell wall biosynthesis
MKLLFLNYEYPPLGGGAGVCTKYQAEGLADLGHQVDVLTTWFHGEKEVAVEENLRIFRIKSKRRFIHKSNPLEMLSWVKHAKNFYAEKLQKENYDFCLANFSIPGGLVSKWIKEKFGLPYLILSHGQDIPWFMPTQLFLYHLINYKKIQKILRESERNILLTKMMKDRADKMLTTEESSKNIIIPNAADVDFFSPKISPAIDFSILFSSRLVKQKDPFTFLKALNVLHERDILFNANIIGDGPLTDTMKKYVRKQGFQNKVNFHGWISKKELLQFYHKSALMIITSKEEAMSLALLEALNCGLYTITTPVSGSKEMIEAKINGDFINFKDYLSLAEKIIYFKRMYFDNQYLVPEKRVNKIKLNFNWNKIVLQYHTLLTELKNA